MQQVTPKDAWFVYAESPRFRQAFVSVYAFVPDHRGGGLPGREEIAAWVEARASVPVLRRRLVRVPLDLDDPYWAEDPDFSVARHLHFHDPQSWDDLRAMLGDLAAAPMDQTRPLWELHVVDRVDGVPGTGGPVTVAAIKMHHVMADGIASGHVTTTLFGADLPEPGPVCDGGQQVPGTVRLVVRALAAAPRTAARFVGGVRDARAVHRRLVAERENGSYPLPPQRRTPTVVDGPVGPGRVYEVEFFPLSELQAIKARIGDVTVNDLTLTIVGGAIRDYLLERGELVSGSLAASVPMTLRSSGAALESNNQFVMMTVDLRTDLDDPVDRARAVHETVLAERRRMRVPAEVAAAETTYVLPGWVFRLARWREARRGSRATADPVRARAFNTFVTSVPRRSTALRLVDTTAVLAFGTSTLDGTGISHSVGSTGDSLALNITADPALLRDSCRYAELIRRSFEQLRDAVPVNVGT
ncbi:wax ester/triacylglycerol synthase domain-containing protein [Rhodococcus sp. NPDC003348]